MSEQRQVRLELDTTELHLTPGVPGQVAATVTNSTPVIDSFRLTVLGLGGDLIAMSHPEVSLFPDTDGESILTFNLPTSFPAGRRRLDVRVASETDPGVFGLASLTIVVPEHPAVESLLNPAARSAGTTARYGVAVTNVGNTSVTLDVRGSDDENHLRYSFSPNPLDVDAGHTASLQVSVSGRRPITGIPVPRAFVLTLDGAGVHREHQALVTQRPFISQVVLTLASVVLMMGLWAVVVGGAIDAVIDDTDNDLANAFGEGIESVLEATGAGQVDDPVGAVLPGEESSVEFSAPSEVEVVARHFIDTDPPLKNPWSVELDDSLSAVRATTADPDSPGVLLDLPTGSYQLAFRIEGYRELRCLLSIPDDDEVWCAPEGGPVTQAERDEDGVLQLPFAPKPAFIVMLADGAGEVSVSLSRLNADIETPEEHEGTDTPEADPILGGGPYQGGGTETSEESVPIATEVETAVKPDADGRLRIEVPPEFLPGTFEILIEGPEGTEPIRQVIEIGPGETLFPDPVEIAHSTDLGFAGKVVNSRNAAAIGGATVAITGPDGYAVTTTSLTEGEVGAFSVDGLAPGDYTVSVSLDGYDTFVETITLPLEESDSIRATLAAAPLPLQVTVSGGSVDDDRNISAPALLLDYWVDVINQDGPPTRVRTVQGGQLAFEKQLAPGDYVLEFSSPGYGSRQSVIWLFDPDRAALGNVVLTPLDDLTLEGVFADGFEAAAVASIRWTPPEVYPVHAAADIGHTKGPEQSPKLELTGVPRVGSLEIQLVDPTDPPRVRTLLIADLASAPLVLTPLTNGAVAIIDPPLGAVCSLVNGDDPIALHSVDELRIALTPPLSDAAFESAVGRARAEHGEVVVLAPDEPAVACLL